MFGERDKCVWADVYDPAAALFYTECISFTTTNLTFWTPPFENARRCSTPRHIFNWISALSLMLSFWISGIIYKTNLRHDLSYYNLFKFTLLGPIGRAITLIRNIYFMNSSSIVTCKVFAFVETFCAVAELEALTMACIERYVVAKYKVNGWARNINHYILYNLLIFIFASLYSFAPMLWIGKYGYDFSCLSYTYDMVLPSFWLPRHLTVLVFLLRSVKPAVVMVMMLIWARTMESKLFDSVENLYQKRFTNIMAVAAVVNILCWTPLALTRGWVILNQMFHDDLVMPPSLAISWSFILLSVSPAINAIALFLVDSQIRSRMFNLPIFGGKADLQIIEETDKNRLKIQ